VHGRLADRVAPWNVRTIPHIEAVGAGTRPPRIAHSRCSRAADRRWHRYPRWGSRWVISGWPLPLCRTPRRSFTARAGPDKHARPDPLGTRLRASNFIAGSVIGAAHRRARTQYPLFL